MAIDAYIAFGGVALLGLTGFCAAWFSNNEAAPTPGEVSDAKRARKQRIVSRIAEVEEKLQAVSSQVKNL